MALTEGRLKEMTGDSGAAGQVGTGEGDFLAALRRRDPGAFELMMRRHNRLLFRTARAILKNDADAEEIVQETYLKAYFKLDGFAGNARLATWLVRIAVNEALGRLRRRMPAKQVEDLAEDTMSLDPLIAVPALQEVSPEAAAARGELRQVLEAAIDGLPQAQRAVFVLRVLEEFSVEDTASCLQIPPQTVKSRLHRAKRQLQRGLQRHAESALKDTFPFAGQRCDRTVTAVRQRLGLAPPGD